MRILLAQNSPYWPAHGGGDKSNRLLLEALAPRGHTCRAVARLAKFGTAEHREYVDDLTRRSVPVHAEESGVVRFELGGVDVRVVTNHASLRGYFSAQIADFDPDIILSSTDDPAQILLEAALKAARAGVVYLARATLALPFGPDAAFPSEPKASVLRSVDQIVGVSEYVAGYVRRWGNAAAVHVPISLMEPGPYPRSGSFENEFITLVNPCAVKGISIFLALADRIPHLRFAAVPTWGTNTADRAALAARPNVTILPPADRIDDILARTRVLLVPSLWAEARSRIIVEAMLRGVPVIAADVGGIPEAKMGVPYLMPVLPISKYRPALDENMVPVAEVPEQDIAPWQDSLERLTTDRAHFGEIATASRRAALQYVGSLNIEPFEALLQRMIAAPRRERAFPSDAALHLSPEKRRLLALRLKQKQESEPGARWFPGIAPSQKTALRVFAFPHAGGSVAAFRGWRELLPSNIELVPVRLPGRESRGAEPAFDSMQDLLPALIDAMHGYLDGPYALYGHSMGAAVAFELARALRSCNRPMPACLLVSAARAPQFRKGWTPPPEPDESAFLEQLRRLEGVPASVLDNPDLLRVLLPALRADARLYRNYIYTEAPPLPCPIRAYGGFEDANITCEHLEAWSAQTGTSFRLRCFPGGHFFIDSGRDEFLRALSEDLLEFL